MIKDKTISDFKRIVNSNKIITHIQAKFKKEGYNTKVTRGRGHTTYLSIYDDLAGLNKYIMKDKTIEQYTFNLNLDNNVKDIEKIATAYINAAIDFKTKIDIDLKEYINLFKDNYYYKKYKIKID